jgi:hypothetical protein
MNTEAWRGGSGILYSYTVLELGLLPNVAFGNYIFAKRTVEGGWEAIHVGHGDLSLRTDLSRHERRDFILERGATHVHFRENPSLPARMVERADILDGLAVEAD